MAEQLPHLTINPFFTANPYTYPGQGGGAGIELAVKNRTAHANNLIKQLNAVQQQFQVKAVDPTPENIVKDESLYVEFLSDYNFPLDFDALNSDRHNAKYQLLNIKKETVNINGEDKDQYRVVVVMKPGAIGTFLKKAGEYMVENTKDKLGNDTGLPKHRNLLNNIQSIQLATLRSFWTDEPEIPFPNENANVWWEAWFRKTDNETLKGKEVLQNLQEVGASVGQQILQFPEHTVRLIKGTAKQLSESIFLLDNLAELRKPQQLNNFITNKNIDLSTKETWQQDLLKRTKASFDENSVLVYLLDSGVNNLHPLITPFLPTNRLYTYKQAWGTEDTWEDGGHGTGMGGLALYGDLTTALASPSDIQIFHGLVSFKIVHPSDPNTPNLYGSITETACSTPVVDFPQNPRIYCLSITDSTTVFKGRPSTWSAAVDKITFGRVIDDEPQLMIVSGGNVNYMQAHIDAQHYNSYNLLESIHDPSQSYNALTVGSYTRMDRIDQTIWPNVTPLANNGHMSPSNSTSLLWDDQWPYKPDIVMEGGNLGRSGSMILDNIHTLKPLSLDKDFQQYIFNPFGDTSGAAALASKLAAELKTKHGHFWPETIRGLMAHSAEWTDVMLNGVSLSNATVQQKKTLLRSFGYGVPIERNAFYSAQNSVTLISQNYIQPFRMDGSAVKTNEYHLYEIPWPTDILQNILTDKDVTLKLTLSYFIDPNPGNRRYANNFSYYSHGLDFKVIKPAESLDVFKRRVSGAEENQHTTYQGQEEPWILKESCRNKGSLKKDFIICSGADLALRNMIAIYPKHGWYSSRKRLGLAESIVRYSLIISIETEGAETDLYTAISSLIENTLPL
ncbi:S8 family peptidase [Terrimonas sp. NA20]|uniref:S8 family peptidase n=1 Tax=Terrimonas ginsenosidimutans TaxID=2908004 RepID=A0ABS9KK17_9BACT|nr:S8 family peptidase [Terrimonas ginsenosidimutans]MCG2612668.1 S8 family peptidase [Terrimonas ginsenosidimutans]